MAGVLFAQQSPKVTFTTISKTIVQMIAATNQKVKIKEISVSFDGTSNTATPIQVDVVRQTSAGTLTNASTMRAIDPDEQVVIQTTGRDTSTAEPTDSGAIVMSEYVHPQTGFLWQAPFGGEILIPGAGRLGVRLVTPAAGADCVVRIVAEE